MKKVLGIAIWLCCIAMMVMPSISTMEEVGKGLGYRTVTFETKYGISGYSSFLTRLRNIVEAPVRSCGIQVTRQTPLRGAEFVQVDLKISKTQWVTLGIQTTNLYVVGYQDKYKGQYRANMLKRASRGNLFPNAKTVRTTPFDGSYKELEGKQFGANTDRSNTQLGITSLDNVIKSVYGKVVDQKIEARFFLTVIQMVSEAARFKYIENKIVAAGAFGSFKPDLKTIALQNNWDVISGAIHKADAAVRKCTNFNPPLVVSTIGWRWEVTRVDDIKNDLGILKYKSSRLDASHSLLSRITSSIASDDDVADDALAFLEPSLM